MLYFTHTRHTHTPHTHTHTHTHIHTHQVPAVPSLCGIALSTLTCYVEWMDWSDLLYDDCKLLRLLYSFISVEQLKINACECLLAILSRKVCVHEHYARGERYPHPHPKQWNTPTSQTNKQTNKRSITGHLNGQSWELSIRGTTILLCMVVSREWELVILSSICKFMYNIYILILCRNLVPFCINLWKVLTKIVFGCDHMHMPAHVYICIQCVSIFWQGDLKRTVREREKLLVLLSKDALQVILDASLWVTHNMCIYRLVICDW